MTSTRIDPDGEQRTRLETWESDGYHGIVVREAGTTIQDGVYIHCERPMEERL